jgi:hypothetical protein
MPIFEIPSKLFHYDREDRVYSAEVSDLDTEFLGFIFKGSRDRGFTMVQASGAKATFHLFQVDYSGADEDREIGGWNFAPIAADVLKNPALKGLRVCIIND